MAQPGADYKLPNSLVGRADLARLVREIETIDGQLEATKVTTGAPATSLPLMSRALTDFLELNKLDLANDQQRMILKEQLRKLKDVAPLVHMTFATPADPESLQLLVSWFRENTHPQALLSAGLQPSLVGGVYLRTPNHVHDFTMKALFAGKRDIVVQQLEELSRQVSAAPAGVAADAGATEPQGAAL